MLVEIELGWDEETSGTGERIVGRRGCRENVHEGARGVRVTDGSSSKEG